MNHWGVKEHVHIFLKLSNQCGLWILLDIFKCDFPFFFKITVYNMLESLK